MGIVGWVVTGLVAASIAGMVTGRRAEGCVTKIGVGVIGALVGGALARAAGFDGVTEFGLRSILVAAVGATLLLLVLGAIEGRPGARRLP